MPGLVCGPGYRLHEFRQSRTKQAYMFKRTCLNPDLVTQIRGGATRRLNFDPLVAPNIDCSVKKNQLAFDRLGM